MNRQLVNGAQDIIFGTVATKNLLLGLVVYNFNLKSDNFFSQVISFSNHRYFYRVLHVNIWKKILRFDMCGLPTVITD